MHSKLLYARVHTAPRWFIVDFKWLLTDSERTENGRDRERPTKGVLFTVVVNGIHVRHKFAQHTTFVSIQNGIDAQHSYTRTPTHTCMSAGEQAASVRMTEWQHKTEAANKRTNTNALQVHARAFTYIYLFLIGDLLYERFVLFMVRMWERWNKTNETIGKISVYGHTECRFEYLWMYLCVVFVAVYALHTHTYTHTRGIGSNEKVAINQGTLLYCWFIHTINNGKW